MLFMCYSQSVNKCDILVYHFDMKYSNYDIHDHTVRVGGNSQNINSNSNSGVKTASDVK